ncbi:MAG: hypothetical protein AAF517_10785 [Planctomycetota bacterium]
MGVIRVISVAIGCLIGTTVSAQSGGEESPVSISIRLDQLCELARTLRTNLDRQHEVWPTRDRDQVEEIPPNAAVRELQKVYERTKRRMDLFLGEVRSGAQTDGTALFTTILDCRDSLLRRRLIEVALDELAGDPGLFGVLSRLARRDKVCPPEVSRGLVSFRNQKANELLYEIGVRERSAKLLGYAMESGDPEIVGRVVRDADDQNKAELAAACFAALQRSVPPDTPSAKLLRSISSWIRVSPNESLRAVLVIYLARSGDPSFLRQIREIYERADSRLLRTSALRGLGFLGAEASEFLVKELETSRDISVRRACISALGVSKSGPAIPVLVNQLSDRQLRQNTIRALRRITGANFGNDRAAWLRWWRAQAGNEESLETDPDTLPLRR